MIVVTGTGLLLVEDVPQNIKLNTVRVRKNILGTFRNLDGLVLQFLLFFFRVFPFLYFFFVSYLVHGCLGFRIGWYTFHFCLASLGIPAVVSFFCHDSFPSFYMVLISMKKKTWVETRRQKRLV